MQRPIERRPDKGRGREGAKVCVLGSFAEALVMTAERLPQPGETVLGRDYRETFGGKGSDMAVQAARLGAAVSFLGVVGDDAFGRGFLDLMRAEGVDVSYCRVAGEVRSGVGMVIKDAEALNLIAVDPGANALFSREDVDAGRAAIAACDVLLAQLEIPLDTALYGLALGRELGVTTVLNPAPAVDLRGVDLSFVDVITPNETEARVSAGLPPGSALPDRSVAALLAERGPGAVVITGGGRGAEIFAGGLHERVAAPKVQVVDSNGAGDSFNAGLAVGLGEGLPLPEATRFAVAVATLSCTRWETVPSYHRRDEVESYLAGAAVPRSAREQRAAGGSA